MLDTSSLIEANAHFIKIVHKNIKHNHPKKIVVMVTIICVGVTV